MKLIDRFVSRELVVNVLFAILVLSLVLVVGNIFRKLLPLLVNPDVPMVFRGNNQRRETHLIRVCGEFEPEPDGGGFRTLPWRRKGGSLQRRFASVGHRQSEGD